MGQYAWLLLHSLTHRTTLHPSTPLQPCKEMHSLCFCSLDFPSCLGHLAPLMCIWEDVGVSLASPLIGPFMVVGLISLLLSFRHFCVTLILASQSWAGVQDLSLNVKQSSHQWLVFNYQLIREVVLAPPGCRAQVTNDTESDQKHSRLCEPSSICRTIQCCGRRCTSTRVGTPSSQLLFQKPGSEPHWAWEPIG